MRSQMMSLALAAALSLLMAGSAAALHRTQSVGGQNTGAQVGIRDLGSHQSTCPARHMETPGNGLNGSMAGTGRRACTPFPRLADTSDLKVLAGVSQFAYCHGYAKRAVAVRQKAARCRLTGARYDASENDHWTWCWSVAQKVAEAEEAARTKALQACSITKVDVDVPPERKARPVIRPVGVELRCRAYAERASAIRDEAGSCGLTGLRYSATFEGHLAWCKSVPEDLTKAEELARDTELRACSGCRDWVGRIRDQFQRASTCSSVSPDEPRWQEKTDEERFQSCFVAPLNGVYGVSTETVQESAERDADLANCE